MYCGKKYLKTKKYLLAKTPNHVYLEFEPMKYENDEEFSSKIYKDAEEDCFIDLEEAIEHREDYMYYYEIGLRSKAADYCEDLYELGKMIEENNEIKCAILECEDCYCYNDKCEFWNPEEHDGLTKSMYDEGREFISNFDPNDPADEWFFED